MSSPSSADAGAAQRRRASSARPAASAARRSRSWPRIPTGSGSSRSPPAERGACSTSRRGAPPGRRARRRRARWTCRRARTSRRRTRSSSSRPATTSTSWSSATGGIVSLRPGRSPRSRPARSWRPRTRRRSSPAATSSCRWPGRWPRTRRRPIDPRDPFASPLAWLRPIDSEHSAIWQCLVGEPMARRRRAGADRVRRPVPRRSRATSAAITPEQALRHPTWSMGAKITIDSATLANKGLEVIEAHWLYDVAYDAIDVVDPPAERRPLRRPVRRRLPQGPAGHPRHATPDPVRPDLSRPPPVAGGRRPTSSRPAGSTSGRPTRTRFPALRIAREAGRLGPRATAALIAADEVAVARFLDGTLDFTGHPAPARGGGDALRRAGADQAPDVDDAGRARRRGPGRVRGRPGRRSPDGRTCSDGLITIVLFIVMLGGLVLIHELGHFVTARLAEHPRPRVRDRVPAPRQGPAGAGRDALHAELAADRRLREARGRGRRRGRRSALVRRASAADQARSSWSPASS